MKVKKTNALRILDSHHIIDQVDLEADQIYKTLVLKSQNDYLVCCIPVLEEIDLKKLAKQSGHKSVEMIHMKDLLSVTGYIRGGCSPIGMKKLFPTYFQEDIILYDKVAVSAGMRGLQVILNPNDLVEVVKGTYVDVIRK